MSPQSLELQKDLEMEHQYFDNYMMDISSNIIPTDNTLKNINNILTYNEHIQDVIGLYTNLEKIVGQLDFEVKNITDKHLWINNNDLTEIELNFNEEILLLKEVSSNEFDDIMKMNKFLEKKVKYLDSEMEIILKETLTIKKNLTKMETDHKGEIRSLKVVLVCTIIGIIISGAVSFNNTTTLGDNYLSVVCKHIFNYIIFYKKSIEIDLYERMSMARKMFITFN